MKLSINEFQTGDKIKTINNEIVEIIDINLNKQEFKIKINENEKIVNKVELFNILTNKYNTIFTHNCQMRMICGQLGSVASRMALDDNSATMIDGSHKGSGMIKAQGVVTNIQYYFEEQKWIEQWFADRGLNSKGYDPSEFNLGDDIDPNEINLGEDEEITIKEDIKEIKFNGIEKQVNNNRDQKFEEI